MSEWTLMSSLGTPRGCQLVYRSEDGLLGLHIASGGTRPDLRHYFIWGKPASATTYATEAEARAALAAQEGKP